MEHPSADQAKSRSTMYTGCIELRCGGMAVLRAQEIECVWGQIRHDGLQKAGLELEEVAAQGIHLRSQFSERVFRAHPGGCETLE